MGGGFFWWWVRLSSQLCLSPFILTINGDHVNFGALGNTFEGKRTENLSSRIR